MQTYFNLGDSGGEVNFLDEIPKKAHPWLILHV